MDIIFIIFSLGFIATIFSLVVTDSKIPVLAVLISLVAGIMILFTVIPSIKNIFDTILRVTNTSGINNEYLYLAIKVVGVSYLGEFIAEICRDAGQGSIAKKIEFGIKIVIVMMALPLLNAIIGSVFDLLG